MLVHEAPLVVESDPGVADLDGHDGSEDQIFNLASCLPEVLGNHLIFILIFNRSDVSLQPGGHCATRLPYILAGWGTRVFGCLAGL